MVEEKQISTGLVVLFFSLSPGTTTEGDFLYMQMYYITLASGVGLTVARLMSPREWHNVSDIIYTCQEHD